MNSLAVPVKVEKTRLVQLRPMSLNTAHVSLLVVYLDVPLVRKRPACLKRDVRAVRYYHFHYNDD